MDFKKFWKTTDTAFFLKNVIAAAAVGLVLLFVLLFWLARFTRHGDEVEVPSFVGLYVEEAEILAQNEGLRVTVIDSTYSRKAPLGSIVDQNPPANSHAKSGREIYVIVNAKAVRQVPIPDLRDVSYRQAEASLRVLGIEVSDVEYEPSEYRDLVLDIRHDGRSVAPGSRLKEGSKVVLVVGFGQGSDFVSVPDLTGKNREEARSALLSSRLIIGSVDYDTDVNESNENLFVVYGQSVRAGESLLEGSRVDIRMTTDLGKAASSSAVDAEEDFF